jgi:hypothetical protein
MTEVDCDTVSSVGMTMLIALSAIATQSLRDER